MDQLQLPLEVPRQPEPQVGDKVRCLKVGYRQAYPGAPAEYPVHVIDGTLRAIVEPGELPAPDLIRNGWFGKRSSTSKYRRVVILREFQRGRSGAKFIKGEAVTLDSRTRLFKYDLCE